MTADSDPSELGPRGSRLLEALTPEGTDEARRVLAEEAARLADRLDELNSIIAGKGVLRLMQFRVPGALEHYDEAGDKHVTVEVKFDAVLSEARQQAATLRQLLAELNKGAGRGEAPDAEDDDLSTPL